MIHPQLLENSFIIGDLQLSQVILKNDKETPWILLVPKRISKVELIDLEFEDQEMLLEEINFISHFFMQEFSPDKINIAMIGNIVPQLHVHIIARFKKDRAWPRPLWGEATTSFFSEAEVAKIQHSFNQVKNEIDF